MDNIEEKSEELVRIQKVIADSGLCSRRQAETYIEEGFVNVNGKLASLGQKVSPQDNITVRGTPLRKRPLKQESIVIIINKPKGYVCSHRDPYNSNTIYDLLPKELNAMKLICTGRLDKDSEGLVVLTSDGDLANKIMHPSSGIVKKYRVELDRPLDDEIIPKLIKGILDDGERLFANKIIPATMGANRECRAEVHLEQGRKREIKRLFARFGYHVERLFRFQVGRLVLKRLTVGGHRKLKKQEIDLLLKN